MALGILNFPDSQVLDIIQEEADAYFRGDKIVEDTVAIIENRVGVYINEN